MPAARESLIAELESTVKDDSPEDRIRMLRRITDLFLGDADRLNDEQVRLSFQSSVEPLPSLLADAARARSEIIEQLACLPCWTFRYGCAPQFAAEEILSFLSRQKQELTA